MKKWTSVYLLLLAYTIALIIVFTILTSYYA